MDRFEDALSIPFIVFPAAAAVAIVIAWILHNVPKGMHVPAALVMVVVITALGFILAARVDDRA